MHLRDQENFQQRGAANPSRHTVSSCRGVGIAPARERRTPRVATLPRLAPSYTSGAHGTAAFSFLLPASSRGQEPYSFPQDNLRTPCQSFLVQNLSEHCSGSAGIRPWRACRIPQPGMIAELGRKRGRTVRRGPEECATVRRAVGRGWGDKDESGEAGGPRKCTVIIAAKFTLSGG